MFFFLIRPKCNCTRIQELEHCYSKSNSKEICLVAPYAQANENFAFISAIAVHLFLLPLSFTCN